MFFLEKKYRLLPLSILWNAWTDQIAENVLYLCTDSWDTIKFKYHDCWYTGCVRSLFLESGAPGAVAGGVLRGPALLHQPALIYSTQSVRIKYSLIFVKVALLSK